MSDWNDSQACVERSGAPTYVDQRRVAPTAADQIGADWRRPILRRVGWRAGLHRPAPSGADRRRPDWRADWRRPIPTDADTAWQRPSATMLEPSKHPPPTPRFSLYF